MTNLSLTLREAAQMYPDRPAVRVDSTALTYAQLDDLSARAADWLRERGLLPDAWLHVYPDGHLGLLTRAAELASVVSDFLLAVEPGAGRAVQ